MIDHDDLVVIDNCNVIIHSQWVLLLFNKLNVGGLFSHKN